MPAWEDLDHGSLHSRSKEILLRRADMMKIVWEICTASFSRRHHFQVHLIGNPVKSNKQHAFGQITVVSSC
jgi:hypothetical protein